MLILIVDNRRRRGEIVGRSRNCRMIIVGNGYAQYSTVCDYRASPTPHSKSE
ncbi:MAG: hypothetical protein SPJ03_10655 [Candidatus Cryptobacteroides sp.]|nr:hypothetical protein [Candidatus Cryptobacteroides sp.]